MPLIYQSFFLPVGSLKIKPILKILIISIGISGNVSAQSLNEYCLSTVGKLKTANKTPVFDPTPKLPLFIDLAENLLELYKKPCNKLYRFVWGSCDRADKYYYGGQ